MGNLHIDRLEKTLERLSKADSDIKRNVSIRSMQMTLESLKKHVEANSNALELIREENNELARQLTAARKTQPPCIEKGMDDA